MRRHAQKSGREARVGKTAPSSGRISLVSLMQVLVVAEYLNFRHAAHALGVTQSSVSARIKALEEALGILLFERRHRGVRLTEVGRQFVVEVSAGIAHLDLAIKTAGAASSGVVGHLAIGLISSISGGFLANLRARFRETYPDVEQIVVEGPSAQTISLVRDGKLDVAFVLEPVDAPDCHSKRLWSEPFLIALPADHPLVVNESVSWLDLAPNTFLIRTGGAGPQLFEHVVCRIVECGKSPHIRRCDVERDTLMHMIAAGEGVAPASETAKHMSVSGIAFRPIADEVEQARFSAVWSPHNRNPALKNLLDMAIAMSRSARSA
ncbi:LysR family transcriptional regulator [Pinisolibacter sp. B13]|nr:LysR family transcriptional regulator [Pinisolibacter aquiterrae]